MKDFKGKLAVVTGGGTGMGRELVRQLVAEGCHVATCDVSDENMRETQASVSSRPAPGVQVARHSAATCRTKRRCSRFAMPFSSAHETDHINLLFNNAGIGGGGSFIDRRSRRVGANVRRVLVRRVLQRRAFMPLLVASTEGYIVNTSSVNGFWATLGPIDLAHRVQRGEIRGEGLLRSARDRSATERAARESGGRDARPHRHVDRDQYRQGARSTGAEGHERGRRRDDSQTYGRTRHAGRQRNRRSDSRSATATGDSIFATRRRSRQRKRRTSFSTACATIVGAFSSATMRTRSTAWCAKRPSRRTKRTF